MRISGINIPDNKQIKFSLTHVFGIGQYRASEILKKIKINEERQTKDLTSEEVNKIQKAIDSSYAIEGELKQRHKQNIKRLKDIGSYRGERHSRNLPVHGQRTKTNSRTSRGNVRKTAVSGRRKASLK